MKILLFILIFLLFGAFFIISENNLRLNSGDNLQEFFKLYISWIEGLIENTSSITGNVIKTQWLPEK